MIRNPKRTGLPLYRPMSWRDVQADGLDRMARGASEFWEGLADFTWRASPKWYSFYLVVVILIWGVGE